LRGETVRAALSASPPVYRIAFQQTENGAVPLRKRGKMQIKFSKQYAKIRGITRAKLLLVMDVKLEHLSLDFLEYDTDGNKYGLPKRGDYLMLVFQKGDSRENIFTTLRRSTPEKRLYYRNAMGKSFDVVVEPQP
jgi:hypothetical protein